MPQMEPQKGKIVRKLAMVNRHPPSLGGNCDRVGRQGSEACVVLELGGSEGTSSCEGDPVEGCITAADICRAKQWRWFPSLISRCEIRTDLAYW